MVISIGSDHGGFELKEKLVTYLENKGYTVINNGCMSKDSVHYPEYAGRVAKDVQEARADYGIICCTSGIGVAISANKFKGIRAAVIRNITEARLCKEHNNCNVITFGEAFTSFSDACACIDTFLATEFGGGRHEIRVNMIKEQEENNG